MAENLYPIRAVAKLTGVNASTIDKWERRHGAVKPKSSAHGRLYSEQMVQRIRLLRDAIANGHHIRHLAKTEDHQLRLLAQSPHAAMNRGEEVVDAVPRGSHLLGPLLEAIEAFDSVRAERELNRLAAAIADPRQMVHDIALPLMRVVGERWHEGTITIAQEHMVTALLTGLLASMLRMYGNAKPAAKVLLATPENEHHGFGILAAAMLTAAKGMGAVHLGTNLPASELVMAARKTGSDAVLLGVCGANTERVILAMSEIRKGLRGCKHLWIGGDIGERLSQAAEQTGWKALGDFRMFEEELDRLAAVTA